VPLAVSGKPQKDVKKESGAWPGAAVLSEGKKEKGTAEAQNPFSQPDGGEKKG